MNYRAWKWGGLTVLLAVVIAGCATTPKIDWAARVGHYTFDQAAVDMGPPDKFAKLSDGSIVAEWMQRPRETFINSQPYLVAPPYYYAPVPLSYTSTTFPPLYLRLVFAPSGQLREYKDMVR